MGDRDRDRKHDDDDTKLFVGNITYDVLDTSTLSYERKRHACLHSIPACLLSTTTKKDLEDVFSKFGTVLEVRIAEEPGGGRSRGYAFVTMEDAKDASDAVRDGSGVIVDGREIKVEVATGVRGSGSRGGNSGACYDFQRGQCSRGSSCKFSHDGEDTRGGGGGGGGGRDRDSRDDRGGRDRERDRDSNRRDDRGRDSDRGRDDRRGGPDRYSERDRDRDGGRERSDRGRERSRDRDNGRDRDSDRRDSRRERDRSRDDDRSSRRDSDRR